MTELRALSVWNPWAWALVTTVPMRGGQPLKTLENRGHVKEGQRGKERTGKLWESQRDVWTLIHTGLHKPDPEDVEGVESMANSLLVDMPDWARKASTATINGKSVGAIVGAVVFTGCVRPEDVPDGYDRIWVNDAAGYCWLVGKAMAFERHIPCVGGRGFFVLPPEAGMLARAELLGIAP
jgi:hypothetical protein